jgi:hypothetical protein
MRANLRNKQLTSLVAVSAAGHNLCQCTLNIIALIILHAVITGLLLRANVETAISTEG